jgi:hypothetical protein
MERFSSSLGLNRLHAFVVYIVCAVGAMILLRTIVDELDFLSVGWIIVLAILPLLPWLLPRLGGFLRDISPYVQSFKLGAIQLDLRASRGAPIAIPTATGILAGLPNDASALSSGTAISTVVSSLRELRRQGGGPVGIIDLQDGRKWRLPNLYFLARLLEMEPVVSELVFTEIRSGTDGFLVGTARPDEFRRRVEQVVPAYAAASASLPLPEVRNLADATLAQPLGEAFLNLLNLLPPGSGDSDPVRGYVTSKSLTDLMGSLSKAAVEGLGETLSEPDLRTILQAPHRFVPTTMEGRLTGLIDREAVALAVARAALAQT